MLNYLDAARRVSVFIALMSWATVGLAQAPVGYLTQSSPATLASVPFTLAWSSSNATTCVTDRSLNGGAYGPVASACNTGAANGSCTPAPSAIGTHAFRTICSASGISAAAATVVHTVHAAPAAALSQSLPTTVAGEPFTITWASTNATTCIVDKSVNGGPALTLPCNSANSPNGFCVIGPTFVGTHVYRSTCANPAAAAAAVTVAHVVIAPPAPSCGSVVPSSPMSGSTGQFRVYAYNVANATSLLFKTWGNVDNSQNDIVEYQGVNSGSGTWYADVNLANHNLTTPEYGAFTTHVYGANANVPNAFCGGTLWDRPAPPAPVPSCTISASKASILFTSSVTLSASCGVGVNGYQWFLDGALVSVGTVNNSFFTTTPNKIGVSQFQVRASNDSGVSWSAASNVVDVEVASFQAVKEIECVNAPVFATGGQYVDPDNGVPLNTWSLLARWQNNPSPKNVIAPGSLFANYVTGAISDYTKLRFDDLIPGQLPDTHPFSPPSSSPRSFWQRGATDFGMGGPAIQHYCNQAGMLISTHNTEHVRVVGGGQNDMFGYAWDKSNAPLAFYAPNSDGVMTKTALIVQSDIAVPSFEYVFNATHSNPARRKPHLDVALYAYLYDMSNPHLHPIAVLAGTHDSTYSGGNGGLEPNFDYGTVTRTVSPSDVNQGGVWFGSSRVGVDTKYHTRDFSAPAGNVLVDPIEAAKYRFYRMRVAPEDFLQLLEDINASPADMVSPPEACNRLVPHYPPQKGYSMNLSNYKILYAGVIGEIVLLDGVCTDGAGILENPALPLSMADQAIAAIKVKNPSIFRAFQPIVK